MIKKVILCDNCGKIIFDEDAGIGIKFIQKDLFEPERYETEYNINKAKVHSCNECIKSNVLELLKDIDRKNNEDEYTYLYKCYLKNYYQSVYKKHLKQSIK